MTVTVLNTGVEIETVARGESVVLSVRGEIDLASAPLLQERLEHADATDAATVVVDLAGVTFMDLSGVRLLSDHKRSSAQRLRLVEASPQVRRLGDLLGDPDLLPFD